jgi:hypothetical protein
MLRTLEEIRPKYALQTAFPHPFACRARHKDLGQGLLETFGLKIEYDGGFLYKRGPL